MAKTISGCQIRGQLGQKINLTISNMYGLQVQHLFNTSLKYLEALTSSFRDMPGQFLGESFSHKEIQFKDCCLPVKTNYFPAESIINET